MPGFSFGLPVVPPQTLGYKAAPLSAVGWRKCVKPFLLWVEECNLLRRLPSEVLSPLAACCHPPLSMLAQPEAGLPHLLVLVVGAFF